MNVEPDYLCKMILVEFHSRGHYPEYINNILEDRAAGGDGTSCVFYLSYKMQGLLSATSMSLVGKSVHFVGPDIIARYEAISSVRGKADYYLEYVQEMALYERANHVIFLCLNAVARSRRLWLGAKRFRFSGIFLQSPYRLRVSRSWGLRLFRREFALWLLAKNRLCKSILLLNDDEGACYYQKWSKKIRYLADPVRICEPSQLSVREYHALPERIVTFLHIGVLGRYKGTDLVLDVIQGLEASVMQKARFLFIGRLDAELQRQVCLLNKKVGFDLVLTRSEFITDADFSAYMQQADVLLVANRNVESSSGILNHCLARCKVVIAPNAMYYSERLSSYGGALLFSDEVQLARCIEKALGGGSEYKARASAFDSKVFREEYSVLRFVETIFNEDIVG
ncbi:glycosyltransferase [Coraliomargarita parva]|uniref:glycosyltransferase n=1 Tax=Coraliomargarita parva TaxID=3014050 RepID=UPI0022B38746|nr:glycosyltransferase [Coraliomargarita parva]